MNASYIARAVASIAVCAAGAYSMYVSCGETGIGWAVFGVFIIWASEPKWTTEEECDED